MSWSFPVKTFNGCGLIYGTMRKKIGNGIEAGLAILEENPQEWQGMVYQTNMLNWPESQQTYKLIARESGYVPSNDDGARTWVEAKYSIGEATFTDEHAETEEMTTYLDKTLEFRRPGRGEGICDVEGLKLFGEIDPADLTQGSVGNCWFVAAMSALAEFDQAINDLFVTKELSEDGQYTVRLFDLAAGEFTEVTVDDRITCHPGRARVFATQPTRDNELWPVILEKAFTVFAGGWMQVKGGWSSLAFAALTGCTDTYHARVRDDGTYYLVKPDWSTFEKPNTKCSRGGQWQYAEWPGLGHSDSLDVDGMFERLVEYDASNYLVGAGTCSGNDTDDTDGIVDGHAYSLISAKAGVAGEFDLMLFRNPHGRTEFTGGWHDGGEMWDAHPEVAEELGHVEDPDDGLFWISKEDAFKYFKTFYICCKDMGSKLALDADRPKHDRSKQAQARKAKGGLPQLTADRLVGTWNSSKGHEVEITSDGETFHVANGDLEDDYPCANLLNNERLDYYGLVGTYGFAEEDGEMGEDEDGDGILGGALLEVITFSNGTEWSRDASRALGSTVLGEWESSKGCAVEISEADGEFTINNGGNEKTIAAANFITGNTLSYYRLTGTYDVDGSAETITWSNGTIWSRGG